MLFEIPPFETILFDPDHPGLMTPVAQPAMTLRGVIVGYTTAQNGQVMLVPLPQHQDGRTCEIWMPASPTILERVAAAITAGAKVQNK